MKKMIFKLGIGLLVLTGASPLSAAVPIKTLSGNMPSAVPLMAPVNRLAATNAMHLSVCLPLRNTNELDALIQQVTDPASPQFRHWLTTEQFVAQFGPTEQDVQAVCGFAQSNHLQVTATHSNRLVVELSGQAADVEKAFNVKLNSYQHPSEGRSFYSPDREPTVSASLPILNIGGLNNYYRPHPKFVRITNTNSVNRSGSGSFGYYGGYDYRAAYAPGTTLTGAGQKVALFQADGYYASDVTQYLQRFGLPAVPLTNILLQGFAGIPSYGGEAEVTLDIDMVNSMAPGLSQIIVYEGSENPYDPMLVFSRIASDNAAPIVSCSWGWTGGPNFSGIDQIFKQMILQGQSVFDASGDYDAFLPPGTPSGVFPGSVDDPVFPNAPSDNPYMIQVGGTTLSTAGPQGDYVSETVWNYSGAGIGSAGGISGYYFMPNWQQGVSMAANGGSATMRNLPDVAMVADGIDIILYGGEYFVAGTSAAAPLWAGFAALINQQSVANGRQNLGFFNPYLYSVATGGNYTNYFHDITVGDNSSPASPTEFFAAVGYDLCTGWGSPKGTNFISTLSSGATNFFFTTGTLIPPPKQPWGATLSANNGADPNGLWLLYMQDDNLNTVGGTNYNGWFVTLTTASPVGFAGDNQIYASTLVNTQSFGGTTNITALPNSTWRTVLSVTNWGPSVSSNVFVLDTLPAGITNAYDLPTVGSVTNSSGVLFWNIGTLPVNAGGSLALHFVVNNSGIFTNSATVSAVTSDPNPDDDSANVIVTVPLTTPPVLLPQMVGVGSGGKFQLSITNDTGMPIVIQASTNLLTWAPIFTNVSPFTFTNFDTTNFSRRFYRAVTQ
jgi:uncharacterized repeat protein (TIGR01451 family)